MARIPRGLVTAVIVMFAAFVVLGIITPAYHTATAQEAQPTATPLYTVDLVRELVGDTDGDGVVDPGDTLRYTVTATKLSAEDSGPVEVVVRLDSALVGSVTDITDGGTQGEAGEVIWVYDELAANQPVETGFNATLRTRFPAGRSQLSSVGLVRAQGVELARGATLPLEVVGPLLKINEVSTEVVTDANDTGRLDAGDTVRLTIAYSNTGAGPSQDATVLLNYPEDLIAQVVANPDEGSDDGDAVTWAVGSVPADGEIRSLQLDVRLQSEFPSGVTTLPIVAEVRSDGVIRDMLEIAIDVSGASLTVETALSFDFDQDADGLGDTSDEVLLDVTVANVGDEAATQIEIVADFNERFLEALEATDGGQTDAETGTVTWTIDQIDAGQGRSVTFSLRILSLPEGLPVINNTVRVSSPDAPPAEAQRAIQLDVAGEAGPTVVPTPSIVEQRPAQGEGPLSAITVSVLMGAFLAFSLAAIGFVAARVLRGPVPDTEEERAAQRRLVREIVEGFLLALILFSVMLLGLQNALDQDSVNSIIAGIVGYVAGRVASQK